MAFDKTVDVLIVGAGPVGLLTAYQLARLGISVYIVDRERKHALGSYGRANAIFPRTMEWFDQLGLAEDILQEALLTRESATYKNGERVIPGRIWSFVENIDDTFFDFAIMLRQQFVEGILKRKIESHGVTLHAPAECTKFENLNHEVLSTILDVDKGSSYQVRSKYLIGADGGRSFVRRYSGVPFHGNNSQDKWIRIDGKIKTDLPTKDIYGSIESPTHGNVLWAPLDRGISRIGYVFTKEQEERCGGNVTQEVAMREAIAALAPFKVEFESVEWWTLYSIGQRVAETYQPSDRVILVGDACHTHSSGAAQGLNTGVADAVNLGWKLALTIKGHASPRVLHTYTLERKAAAERLIEFDEKIASLIANKQPKAFDAAAGADTNAALAKLFEDASGLNTGLALSYGQNILNQNTHQAEVYSGVVAGTRAPDVLLQRPGTGEEIRLHKLTPNVAKFYITIFAGDRLSTLRRLKSLHEYLSSQESFLHALPSDTISLLTICTRVGYSTSLSLGIPAFSTTYYDSKRDAHRRYGVNVRMGAIVVVRPDGFVGTTCELSEAGGHAVGVYLGRILLGNFTAKL